MSARWATSMVWVVADLSPKFKLEFETFSVVFPENLPVFDAAEHFCRIQIEVNGKTPQGTIFSLVSSDPLNSSTHDLVHYDLSLSSPFSSLSITFKDPSTGIELFPCSANDRDLRVVLEPRPNTLPDRFKSLALHAFFVHDPRDHAHDPRDHRSPKPRTK